MPAFINSSIISATSFSSNELGVLATIAHPMDTEGTFSVKVLQGDIVVGQTRLTISAGSSADDVTLDLAALRLLAGKPLRSGYELRTGGYVAFFVSQGEARYRILISADANGRAEPKGKTRDESVFDSAKLQSGDVYVLTLVRPGVYDVEMVSTQGGARGELTVSYPVSARRPYIAPEPVTIECQKSALRPASPTVSPGQGVIFRLGVPAAITVKLRLPDDRERQEEPVYRGFTPDASPRREGEAEIPPRKAGQPPTKASAKAKGKPRKR